MNLKQHLKTNLTILITTVLFIIMSATYPQILPKGLEQTEYLFADTAFTPVMIDLTNYFNNSGEYIEYSAHYSVNSLANGNRSQNYNGIPYALGPLNGNCVYMPAGETIMLPQGTYSSIYIFGSSKYQDIPYSGDPNSLYITVNYLDGNSDSNTIPMDHFNKNSSFYGNSVLSYHDSSSGTTARLFMYSFTPNTTKQIKSITIGPSTNWHAMIMAITGNLTSFSGSNISLNKAVTCYPSENSNVGEYASKAVDGTMNDIHDKWSSTGPAPFWLKVDLGDYYTVSTWSVYHAGAFGENSSYNTENFSLQTSVDGNNWVNIDSVYDNIASITVRNITPFITRYLRLYITTPSQNSDPNARIYEFNVYGQLLSLSYTNSPSNVQIETFRSTIPGIRMTWSGTNGDTCLGYWSSDAYNFSPTPIFSNINGYSGDYTQWNNFFYNQLNYFLVYNQDKNSPIKENSPLIINYYNFPGAQIVSYTPRSAPTFLPMLFDDVNYNSVALNWTSPSDWYPNGYRIYVLKSDTDPTADEWNPNASTITTYYNPSSIDGTSTNLTCINVGNATGFTINGLSQTTMYYFLLVALDDNNNESIASISSAKSKTQFDSNLNFEDFVINASFGNDRLKYGAVSLNQMLPFYLNIKVQGLNKYMTSIPDILIKDNVKIYTVDTNDELSNYDPNSITVDPSDPNKLDIRFSSSTQTCTLLQNTDANYLPLSIPVFDPNMIMGNVRIIYQGQNIQTNTSTPSPAPYIYELEPNSPGMDPNIWGNTGRYDIMKNPSDDFYTVESSMYAADPNTQDEIRSLKFFAYNLLTAKNTLPTRYTIDPSQTNVPNMYILDPNQNYVLVFDYKIVYNNQDVCTWNKVAIPLLNTINSDDQNYLFSTKHWNLNDNSTSYYKPLNTLVK